MEVHHSLPNVDGKEMDDGGDDDDGVTEKDNDDNDNYYALKNTRKR